MNRHLRRLSILLGTTLLLCNPTVMPVVTAQPTANCNLQPQVPGASDQALGGLAGELSIEQKHAAFTEVLAAAVRYDDYQFPVAVLVT